nr:DNA methyltransferase [Phenylobacterium haematophilum]
MFPESFVQKQLLAYSRPGDQVFDPFCGRGTTILEGLLNDRRTIGSDINPVAACVAGAKANVPTPDEVAVRIDELQGEFATAAEEAAPDHEFFRVCFSTLTLQQVLFLKRALRWQTDRADRFIAAMVLGVLHGESHKTELCLSNRMPRTISTKPEYSVRWWKARDLLPPERDAFDILRKTAKFRLAGEVPKRTGQVVLGDARTAGDMLSEHTETVSLIVTSPPYLDTTDYAEDQWLRLWFLGGPDRPSARLHKDDRHTRKEEYWTFLSEVWQGCAGLLKGEAHLVVRIGGTMLDKEGLFEGLTASLETGLSGRSVTPLHQGESSTIRKRQTNSFRPGTSNEKMEHDFAFAITA